MENYRLNAKCLRFLGGHPAIRFPVESTSHQSFTSCNSWPSRRGGAGGAARAAPFTSPLWPHKETDLCASGCVHSSRDQNTRYHILWKYVTHCRPPLLVVTVYARNLNPGTITTTYHMDEWHVLARRQLRLTERPRNLRRCTRMTPLPSLHTLGQHEKDVDATRTPDRPIARTPADWVLRTKTVHRTKRTEVFHSNTAA